MLPNGCTYNSVRGLGLEKNSLNELTAIKAMAVRATYLTVHGYKMSVEQLDSIHWGT
jgi:hypothetical protein